MKRVVPFYSVFTREECEKTAGEKEGRVANVEKTIFVWAKPDANSLC